MPRTFVSLLSLSVLATLSAAACAQMVDPAVQSNSSVSQNTNSYQPAPVQRNYTGAYGNATPNAGQYAGQYPGQYAGQPARQQVVDSSPVAGVQVRSAASGDVEIVSANEQGAELRVDHGRVNVLVHHPADHASILVDMPGGQVSLLKDGLYTFNGDTHTVRVLHGEAEAYPGDKSAGVKGIKVKEDHQVAFTTAPGKVKSVDSYPYELTADLLPGEGRNLRGDGGYGDGFYGGGFYGYPGYGYGFYGSPYGYGYGYPFGIGLGFGYYGGFGGFRGGYGGFRGGFRR